MRRCMHLALGLVPILGMAQAPVGIEPQVSGTLTRDPVLQALIQETQGRNPNLAKTQTLVEAEQERVPQAKALPDPSLTLGLQNDGFERLQVGRMETSSYQLMLTQPLPWPGKRGLRGEVAALGVEVARWAAERARLSLVADVKRAYVGLLLVRGQWELLDQQVLLWQKAFEIAKTRYEVGQGSQADLLRAQLEQNRLRQTRWALQAEERTWIAHLNRLRGMPQDAALPTRARLVDLWPSNVPASTWIERADQESPELQVARFGVLQAERSLDLAKRERFPDFAVTAGLMPRGGLDPMWQVSVSVSLPLWSKQKQQRAVAEQEMRRRAAGAEADGIRNLLHQRIQERAAQMEALEETLRIYREGLLVQSEATFRANLAHYEAGRAPFLAVLESLNAWIADRGGYLQALAQAQALQIAQEEFNVAGTPPITTPGLSPSSMGMGGSPGEAAMPSVKSGAATSQGPGSTPVMTSM